MYLIPLREAIARGKPILQDSDIRALFSIIDVIHNLHERFLEKLKSRITNWNETTLIADLFIEFVCCYIVVVVVFSS